MNDLQKLKKLATRVLSGIAGAAIIYHEVYIADSAEPLLVLLGLWLLGIPPALFLDGLRKMTDAANASVDEVARKIQTATEEATDTKAES